MIEAVEKPSRPKVVEEDKAEALTVEMLEPDVLRNKLSNLEDQFTALEGGLDSQERQAMWPRLANLNAALGASRRPASAGFMPCGVRKLSPRRTLGNGFARRPPLCRRGRKAVGGTFVGRRLTTAAEEGREIGPEDLERC